MFVVESLLMAFSRVLAGKTLDVFREFPHFFVSSILDMDVKIFLTLCPTFYTLQNIWMRRKFENECLPKYVECLYGGLTCNNLLKSEDRAGKV